VPVVAGIGLYLVGSSLFALLTGRILSCSMIFSCLFERLAFLAYMDSFWKLDLVVGNFYF